MTYDKAHSIVFISSLTLLASCASSGERLQEAVSVEPVERTSTKNIILMVSDGIGFNGWLAADYYQGRAGQQSYQTVRPDGTRPVVYGMTHDALNLIDASGEIITNRDDLPKAVGAVEQVYDPLVLWDRF